MKQSTLFRKCSSYFQDNANIYRNRGYNALAGQGLWEDNESILYKLSIVNDVMRKEFYIYLQMGKKEDMPTKVIVRSVGGMKQSLKKFYNTQERIKAWKKVTDKLLNWEEWHTDFLYHLITQGLDLPIVVQAIKSLLRWC